MRYHLGHKSLAMIMGGVMLVLCGIGAYVYHARARTLATLRAELKQKQTRLAAAQARIAKRPQLEKEYADLRAQLAVLEPALPTYAYVPTFLKQIEALALDTHNSIGGVRPQLKQQAPRPTPPTAKGKGEAKPGSKAAQPANQPSEQPVRSARQAYDRLPIEVSLTGGYWEAAKFLGSLSTFPKMIAVNDLQAVPVARGETMRGAPDLQVKLNLLALIYKKDGEEESWTSDAKNSPS